MQGGQGGCGQDGNTWKLFELWETKKKIVMVDHVYGETKEVREVTNVCSLFIHSLIHLFNVFDAVFMAYY